MGRVECIFEHLAACLSYSVMTSSGVQHNAMTPWDFARDITAFAESANIDSTAAPGLDMLIGARLVSSFAHVDRRAVFERVASVKAQSAGMHTWAAHTSIDWDVLETHLSTQVRLCLTSFFQFSRFVQRVCTFVAFSCREYAHSLRFRAESMRIFLRFRAHRVCTHVLTRMRVQRHASAHSPAAFWLRLLEYIKFENESAPAEDVAQYIIKLKNNVQVQVPASCSPLDGVRIALQRSGAGAKLDWHTVCSSFILLHVVHEDAAAAIAMHLRSTPQKEVCVPVANEDVGSKLARHLMSFRHTPANIEHTLVALLTAHAHFNTEKLAALLHTFREESARIRVDSQTLFKRFQRVSLTALAQSGNGPTAICSDSTSFAAFVAACRFPMHVPASLQRYVYFLKSMQTRVCLDGTVVTARIERLLQV